MTENPKTKEWKDAAMKHLDKITDPKEKTEFVYMMLFYIASHGCEYDIPRVLGMLELVKQNFYKVVIGSEKDTLGF